jgi:hypothetical protein
MLRQRDEVVPPKTLQNAVDVHGGQAELIGELELRERQPDRVILGQPNRLLPPHQLAEQIGDAPVRAAPSKRDDALAVDRLLLQRAPPERGANWG